MSDLVLFAGLSFMILYSAIQTVVYYANRAFEVCFVRVVPVSFIDKSIFTIGSRTPGHVLLVVDCVVETELAKLLVLFVGQNLFLIKI